MGAPASGKPARVQRRSETVVRAVLGKYLQHMLGGLSILAQDPVAVLAHDGQPVNDHGLARAEQGPQPPPVELRGQIQVRVVHDRTTV